MNNILKTLYIAGIGIALSVGFHLLVNSEVIALLGIVPTFILLFLVIGFIFSLYLILVNDWNNKQPKIYNYRGNARYKQGDNQGAIEDYNQAILLDPNYALAYIKRGAARSKLGDNQGAIEDYNQAILLNANLSIAYENRRITRSHLGRVIK